MTTKHTPATPLPWQHRYISDTKFPNAIVTPDNAREVCLTEARKDAAYLAHAANAYPRQVGAAKELAQMAREAVATRNVDNVLLMDAILRMESLLRELGEL